MNKLYDNKLAFGAAILILITVLAVAYEFRRDGRLTGTSWKGSAASIEYKFTFETGRSVRLTRSGRDNAAESQGTYTCRGTRVEMHFPGEDIIGDAIQAADTDEYLSLTATTNTNTPPINIKVVKTSAIASVGP